jgi:NADH-quinone oxidoreductase subunit G
MTGFRHASKEVKYKEGVRKKGIFIEGKLIAINTDRCILCRRCIRMCGENMGNRVLGIIGRGYWAYVSPFDGDFEKSGCEHCGSCIDVCPVGSLLDRTFKHKGRPWKLDKTWTTCTLCGSACYMEVDTCEGEIKRVVGRIGVNHEDNKGYLCVNGKWGWDIVYSEYRFEKPLLKENGGFKEISFEEAVEVVKEKIEGGDFGVFVDSSLTCEEIDLIADRFRTKGIVSDAFNYQRFLKKISGNLNVCSLKEAFDSDVLVVVGDFVEETNPVIATLLRLKVIQEGKRIIRVGQFPSKLDSVSYRVFFDEDVEKILTSENLNKLLRRKKFSLIIGGTIYDLIKSEEIAETIAGIFQGISVYPIPPESNSYYISEKFETESSLNSSIGVYFVSSNEKFAVLKSGKFKILFTPFFDDFALGADLVIPTETFLEKEGKLYLPGGLEKPVKGAVEAKVSLKTFLKRLPVFLQKSRGGISNLFRAPEDTDTLVLVSKRAKGMLSVYSQHVASVSKGNRVLEFSDSGVGKKVLFVERFDEDIIEILKLFYPYKEIRYG